MVSKQKLFQFCLLVLQMTNQQTCSTRWKRFLKGDYIIGGLFPATSGLHCEILNKKGLIQAEALVFAVEMVNKNTTFLGNSTLGYDLRDTCQSMEIVSEQAMDLAGERSREKNCSAKEISSNRIVAVIGPSSYQAVIAAGGILSSHKIIQITYSAASVKSHGKALFHIMPSAKYEAKALADIVSTFNWTLVNIISSGESYFSQQLGFLEDDLRQRNVCVAKRVQLLQHGLEIQIRKTIAWLKVHQHSRVTILLGDTKIASKIFLEARIQKLSSHLWIGGHAWIGNKDLLGNYSDVIQGSLGVTLMRKDTGKLENHLNKVLGKTTLCNWFSKENGYRTLCSNKNSIPMKPSGQMTTSHMMKNATNSVPQVRHFLTMKYLSLEESSRVVDAVYLIAETLRKARENSGKRGLTNIALMVINSSTLLLYMKATYSRLFTTDNNGAIIGQYHIKNVKGNKNGKLRLTSLGFWKYNQDLSKNLKVNAKDIWWPGRSGKVTLSRCSPLCPPGTFIEKNHLVCCWNCKKCPKWQYSATFRSAMCLTCSEKEMPNANQTGCQTKPESYLSLGDTIACVLLVACVVGESMTLFVVIVFVKFLKTPVVKASNMIYSFFILVILLIWFTMPAFYVGRPKVSTCALRVLSPPVLYTAVSAALLTKTKRLIRIFSTLKKKHRFLSNAWFAFLTCALISVHFVLGLLYLLKFPPQPVIDSNHDNMLIVECSHNFSLDVTASVYNAILCITGAYLAFNSRSLPEHYNEARHICVVMFLFLVSRSALMITHNGMLIGKLKTAVASFTLLTGAYSVLFFIFFPKLRVILFRPERNTMRATLEGTRRYSVDVAANIDMPKFDSGRRHTSPECLSTDMSRELEVSTMPSHLSLGYRISADPLMKTIDEVCQLEQVAAVLKELPTEEGALK